jgi:hypothetical protein
MSVKKIITTMIAIVMLSAPAFALQNPNSASIDAEPKRTLSIQEDNYTCFQDLQCLVSNNPFRKSNLGDIKLNTNSAQTYAIEGTSRNEDMYALYDANGKLIRSTLTQRNIILPRSITTVLVEDQFKEWTMIGNELTVQNFDRNSMIYKVVLQNGSEVKIEYFDRNGNIKAGIS